MLPASDQPPSTVTIHRGSAKTPLSIRWRGAAHTPVCRSGHCLSFGFPPSFSFPNVPDAASFLETINTDNEPLSFNGHPEAVDGFGRPRTDQGVEMREMMVATHDRARGRCGADQVGGGSWQKFPFSDGTTTSRSRARQHRTRAITRGPFGVACCCFVDRLQGTRKDLKQTRQRVPCILSLFQVSSCSVLHCF